MIKRIIFDYGGVISLGSRTVKLAGALGLSISERKTLFRFMSSPDITEAAIGKKTAAELVAGISAVLPYKNSDEVLNAFGVASQPDAQMVGLLESLSAEYALIMISNSIAPYSDKIVSDLGYLFSALYLSDQIGARKPRDLFMMAEAIDQRIFDDSVYVDDVAENLEFPASRGAIPVLFEGYGQLFDDLQALGVNGFIKDTCEPALDS